MKTERFPRLQALRVPTSWKVIINKFFELDPDDPHLTPSAWEYFDVTLFYASMVIDQGFYVLDLGWYPYNDPEGHYGLELHRWMNPIDSPNKQPQRRIKIKKEGVTWEYHLHAQASKLIEEERPAWRNPVFAFEARSRENVVDQMEMIMIDLVSHPDNRYWEKKWWEAARTKAFHTPQQYLDLDQCSEERYEYRDGQLFAIAGASREHNLIVTNFVRELNLALKIRSCDVYASSMRVRIHDTTIYVYPDVIVTAETPEFDEEPGNTLLNPQLIVEVLSESTERHDRGRKFDLYRRIPSLTTYVMAAQNRPWVLVHARREEHTWMMTEFESLDATVTFDALGCGIPMAEIYRRVEFE